MSILTPLVLFLVLQTEIYLIMLKVIVHKNCSGSENQILINFTCRQDLRLSLTAWTVPDANDMSCEFWKRNVHTKHGHKMQNKQGTTLGYKLHRIEMYPFCFCYLFQKVVVGMLYLFATELIETSPGPSCPHNILYSLMAAPMASSVHRFNRQCLCARPPT